MKNPKKHINWERLSEIVAVELPEIASGDITLENILSISVLEWQVKGVRWRMYGKK